MVSKTDAVELIAEETLFQGFFSLKQYRLRHRLFAGGWSRELTRELFVRDPVAAILPYDSISQQVVLVEQFRAGALEQKNPWLLELVAGIIEPGESPEVMVRREMKEETGLDILDLLPICQYWVSPGGANEYLNLFCGRVDASKAGGIYGAKEEDEDIRVVVLPIKEAFAAMKSGKINNAATIIALQWLQLNVDTLKFRND